LSYPAPHENDPRFPALLLLRRILDDGLSSRLRQAVCEQRGLAYSLSASIDAYTDAGVLDVDASCSPRKLTAIVGQILEVLEELAEKGVRPGELERVKTRHQAEIEFVLDDPSELCGWYGASELVGHQLDFDTRLAQTMAVSAQQIEELARDLFDRRKVLLTLVGPAEAAQVTRLEKLLDRRPGSSVWLNEEPEPKRRRLRIAAQG
jgi:predicted Zn-dependent peptidase